MSDTARLASMATIGLGLGQALAPQATAKAFGLQPLSDEATWIARLLGVANVALGSMGLDEDLRERLQPTTYAVLAANATATLAASASGSIPKRTGGLVLAFIGALTAADVSSARRS